MAKIKKNPCRVCGKLFLPCSYCQENTGVFRWRNFACSRECAEKYIAETIAYRNSSNGEKNNSNSSVDDVVVTESNIMTVNGQEEKSTTTKKKYNRKKLTNNVEIINEEREQID